MSLFGEIMTIMIHKETRYGRSYLASEPVNYYGDVTIVVPSMTVLANCNEP
jgi:hypothetical protein